MKEAISCGPLDGEEPEALNYAVMVTRILDKDGKNCTTRGSVKAIDSILKKYTKYCSVYLQGRVVSLLLATPRGFDKYLHILVDDICQCGAYHGDGQRDRSQQSSRKAGKMS